MHHGGTCPSSAELPEFLQRQECGTTETISEAPGAYGIRSCSHDCFIWDHFSTGYTPGSRGRHGAAVHCEWVSPSSVAAPSAPGWTLLFYGPGLPLEQVSRHTVVTTDASSTGWGATCNGQAASGLWKGRSHRISELARHLLLWSHTQFKSRCSHPGEAQSCSRRALTTAHIPRRVATPSRNDPADLEWIRGSSGRPVCFPRVLPLLAVLSLTEGPLGTDALAHSWPRALLKYVFLPVSLLAQTLCKLRKDE